ncbi:EAL and HDOD domain-containing protein [Halanaerobium sp. ST460_2HS_T2]|uniref:EAL and HDOD domain-containing protein n=1 Tax=Halanaerobium sp. ST460_2HS_T2 TaxID=2183914 RepID=UPI000DF15473|nr:HDOD domain-containing protein [Halanaerobium sp. ST460_2HS_T2]RCW57360.1 EAL and modified HD-GYP domain-containing signal transduction protein [Halanaerobium sp. ST460_2HS_T2]
MGKYIAARKPVLDSNQEVFAYEIIFKNSIEEKGISENSKLFIEEISDDIKFFENSNLADGKKVFIHFNADLIQSEVPQLVSKDNLGIEISEDIKLKNEIINTIKKLKDNGCLLILNQSVKNPAVNLYEYADIIKIDYKKASKTEHRSFIETIRNKNSSQIKFLAQNIDEHHQFKEAKAAGFDYFQGVFFTKADMVNDSGTPGYKINYLNVLKELNKADVDFDKIEKLIKNDISMSFSLLKTINSASYGYNVASIKQASALLGVKGLKKWSLLYLINGLKDDKPNILFVNTLTRAKFAESLAEEFNAADKSEDLFTMGIFSMLDAFLNRSMAKIMEETALTEEIKEAILIREGVMGEILNLVIAFERVKWDQVALIERKNQLDPKKLYNKYLKAVDFAYETMGVLIKKQK